MYVSQRVRPGAVLPRDLIGGGLVESNVGWIQKGDQAAAHRNTGIYLHWGATVNCEDTRDPESLARAQREALQELNRDMAVLMEHGYVMHLAPRLGVRECRRVMGEHVVTVNDIKSGKLPDDVIALSDYGLDAWGEKLTREQIDCPRSGIPYRALIPKKTEGLLIAGKSISGTHLAASSYRVQPIVASIGAAAGIAAASAARNKTGVRSLSVADLQRRLKQMGVLVWEGLRADG
jgi:hypothetical protein